jgi:uncharacterized RDD family membrane protein YckC
MEYEDRVRISTPEGVDVELTLAGIGSRFIAAMLDFGIQFSILLATALVLGATGDDRGGSSLAVFTIVFFLIFFGYDVLFEVRSRGRTPGKRWTGLRVVRTGGQPVTFVPSCVRNVMRLVDMLPAPPLYAVGMASIFATGKNQRLGDLAAGTLIVRERPGGLRRTEDAPRFARPVADGWDVSAVSARDIGTVRQFLDRRQSLAGGPREELARELEQRLRPLVAGAPDGLAAEEFLERLSATKK